MKYTKLIFSYDKFENYETNSMNGFAKNKLHNGLTNHWMYVDTDKLEVGHSVKGLCPREKFKKELLKYYNNIINNIEKI